MLWKLLKKVLNLTNLRNIAIIISMTKKKLYNIIFKTDTPEGRFFDEVLLVLIFLWTVIVMLRSVWSLDAQYWNFLRISSQIITFLFTIEYLIRILVHPNPKKYITSFFWIIDLLAIVPWYTWLVVWGHNWLMLRSLRLLRLFRVFNLWKYESAWWVIWKSLWASRTKITVFIVSVLIIVAIVWTLMYLIEWPSAWFDNIPLSIYRSIVTITTVWYGDITPITPIWQALSAILMLLGYGIIAIPTGLVSAEMVSQHHKWKHKKDKKKDH